MSTSELPCLKRPHPFTGFALLSAADEQQGGGAAVWTPAAPKKVVKHFLTGDEEKTTRAWTKHLARRKPPLADSAVEAWGAVDVLLWGLPDTYVDRELLAAVASSSAEQDALNDERRRVIEAIAANDGGALEERGALVLLVCAYELPALAEKISAPLWWELLARLRQTAMDAMALDLAARPLLHQWLAGELPLALAALFPEIAPCTDLLPQARRALSAGIEELLDGEGMPQCRYLAIQQPLAACWTRARMLGASLDELCWDESAEAQYLFIVREVLRAARRDGSSLFEDRPIDRSESASASQFLAAAAEVSSDKGNQSALRGFSWKSVARSKNDEGKRLPPPANHSEWAQAAVLRTDWKPSSPRLGIAYGDRTVRGELAVGRERLFTGEWRFRCHVVDKEAVPDGDWEEVCWVSDDDVDYLELEIHLTEGLRIQRQICLARKDRFLFVADAVLGGGPRSLRHTLRMPLGPGIAASAANESRELALHSSKPCAVVFPLALPEWRIDPRGGELAIDKGAIELRQAANGHGLYVPLWIDLDPARHGKPFTWRQLTVAEERRILPRDSATGYRIQFGGKQWLVYRSLTKARNRTLLGCNLSSEFLIGRFKRGDVTPLIEVE